MEILSEVAALRGAVRRAREAGRTVGFVPTMGALHAGHVSLLRRAREETGFVVAGVFVNPTQFGPNEDLDAYPRTLEADAARCREVGVDVVYAPSARAIYPTGAETYVAQERIPQHLCGLSRPGHFRGVMTVVTILFHQVAPDIAYFGRKDYQQARVIERMTEDLSIPVEIRTCPTVREADGLAMSSRNAYLSAEDRREALRLPRALQAAADAFRHGERRAAAIQAAMAAVAGGSERVRIEYLAVVDPETLDPVETCDATTRALLAARLGGARLIDNIALGERLGGG